MVGLYIGTRTSAERFVPQIGTLSGNPIAAAAGVATLEVLRRPGTYDRYREIGERLMNGLSQRLSAAGIAARVVRVPSTFDVVFGDGDVRNYRDTQRGDPAVVARFNAVLRERGILKNASRYYVSTAHDERDVQHTFSWGFEIELPEQGIQRVGGKVRNVGLQRHHAAGLETYVRRNAECCQ